MTNFMEQQRLNWKIQLHGMSEAQIIAIAKKRGFETTGKTKSELIDMIIEING